MVACPFFLPTTRLDDGGWLHPSRLPLGGGWSGVCSAPGHEGEPPSDAEVHEQCNLGYASACPRLPKERAYDAVRFSVARDLGTQMLIWFVCEFNHQPASHGKLEFDFSAERWTVPHPDPRLQRMAECFLQAYLLRNNRQVPANPPSSTTS